MDSIHKINLISILTSERLPGSNLRLVLVAREPLAVEVDVLQALRENAVEGSIEVVDGCGLVDRCQAQLDERGEGKNFGTRAECDRHCYAWFIILMTHYIETSWLGLAWRSSSIEV